MELSQAISVWVMIISDDFIVSVCSAVMLCVAGQFENRLLYVVLPELVLQTTVVVIFLLKRKIVKQLGCL